MPGLTIESSMSSLPLHEYSDLELAILVCLIAQQHCILAVDGGYSQAVSKELAEALEQTFNLTYAQVKCRGSTSNEDFSEAVLVHEQEQWDSKEEYFSDQTSSINRNRFDERKVANVVVAYDLHLAHRNIQIQALELMRSKRIYTRTAVHSTPKDFLFIAVIPSDAQGPPYLTPHLNDFFAISHQHSESTSVPELSSSESSTPYESSPITLLKSATYSKVITHAQMERLRKDVDQVRTTAEIRRYTHNIVTFLRLHRAVAEGISALSSRHLALLSKVLAPLHSLDFVTPSLVALAARKVFPHRIEVAISETERSVQWGSDKEAVVQMLQGMTPSRIVEEILDLVETPL